MTVRDLKQQFGMTNDKIAETFNIALRTVEDWSSGARQCKPYIIKLMAFALSNMEKWNNFKGE